MGEQSTKSLRGGKMEDVIFGGTQRRKQMGFAEVSLILDNSDGFLKLDNPEVMITRRYYRSGESEYYINRALVRLRDVNELLMDTGLGREGYSIIGQGRIDEILSTKSRDRREIFEEAAGISRFRHRKEESEKKLQQTDENLLRINDKIAELELQINPLREQAETAKKYLLLRDELRGLEISMWLHELDVLRTKADKAQVDHAAAKRDLETFTNELDESFAQSEEVAQEMRLLDIDSDSTRERGAEARERLNELERTIAVLKSQIEGNAAQIEQINQELQSQDGHKDGVGKQISEREERLQQIEREKSELSERADEFLRELSDISGSAGESSAQIGELTDAESKLQSELGGKKSEFSALAMQAQELYDREHAVKQELGAAADALSERAAEHEECAAQLEKLKEEAQSSGNIVSGFTLKADACIKKAQDASQNFDKLSLELKTLESRRNLLSEMEKDFGGYGRAVKTVMQEFRRGVLKNIHGTAAGLLETSDKYAVAIETALGFAAQHIIVDTEEDGKAAINHLKRRDGGRATFLPLSTIKGTVLSEKEVGGSDGFEGVALRLVEFDPKYAGVYANLLGRVIVADDLTNAVKIAKKHNYKFRVVTLDGQVINAGGSMTGGSAASGAGVISRANELKQITARAQECSQTLAQAERVLAECVREKTAVEYELETAQAELRAVEDKLIRLESDEQHFSQLFSAAQAAISSLETELSSIAQRSQKNSAETESARVRISELEQELEAQKARIEEALHGQDALLQAREGVNAKLAGLRAQEASLNAEEGALQKAVSELCALREEMSHGRERQLEAIDQLHGTNAGINAEIAQKEQSSAGVKKEIEAQERRLSELGEKKLELEAQRVTLNKAIQEKNRRILDFERECARLEQIKLTAQMEEKQIVDKLWDTYELSRLSAKDAGAPIENLADAQRSISKLKRQIAELGNPNIGAIEEFERVNTRYTFLSEQRDDVQNAKSELLGMIDEITAHMREIFTREFEIINESFGKTFKKLFGGGHASLELEDPDDVLNCGIEIKVQPPGKSLKTLTLLSGGEKAFVAIAIYFAILSVRPPPFVVLDEIEAALDDANVLRFAEYMRRISDKLQMIVISHRRGTMEEADVLYGVTMQELGVSSILKIDLDEAERHLVSVQEDS